MEAYNELIEQKTEGEITMTNIYTRMLDNEIKQAVERGMKQGIEQGMEKGVEKGKSEMVKALISLGRSIKEIADFYKTDESEIEKMLSMA